MNLLQKQPGKEIRAAARKQLRSSTTLWKEYKKLRRGQSHLNINRWSAGLLVLLFALARTFHQTDPQRLLLILAMYSIGAVFGRVIFLGRILYYSYDLAFFMHMPVSATDFFSYAWGKFLRSSSWELIGFAIVYGYGAFFVIQGNAIWITALAAAVVQWLTLLSLILLLTLYRPQWARIEIPIFFFIVGFATVFVPKAVFAMMEKALLPFPSTWPIEAFQNGILLKNPGAWYWLVPVLPLLLSIPWTFQKLRKRYIELLEIPPEIQLGEEDESISSAPPEQAAKSISDDTTRCNEQLAALAAADWDKSGWMARVFGWILNSREKTVAEFMLAGSIQQWTKLWQIAGVCFAAGVAVTLFISTPYTLVYFGPCLLGAMFGMPILGGNWPGFQRWYSAGKFMPIYSGVPTGYGETSRIIFKANTLRIASCLPFVLVSSAVLGRRIEGDASLGMLLAGEFIFLLLVLQPIAVFLKYSQGTNDTQTMNWHIFFCFVAALLPGALLAAGTVYFFIASGWPKLIAAIAGITGSVLIWALYKLLYERGRIDLLRPPNK